MLRHIGRHSSILFELILLRSISLGVCNSKVIYIYRMTISYIPNNNFGYFFTVTAHMKYNTTDYDYF